MAYRRYLAQLGMLISTGLLLLGLSLAFLWRAGELDAADAIAHRQLASAEEALYGTALNQNTLAYKLALVRAVHPDVLIVGSSRTMQFRQWNFNGRTLTAGGAGASIDEVEFFLERALAVHRPKVIVIGVDFWWFHPDYRAEPPTLNQGDKVTKDKLLWIFREWGKHKIQPADVIQILQHPAPEKTGLNAQLHQEGFRRDGSWQYNLTWRTAKGSPNDLTAFRDTLKRIESGSSQFLHGQHADPERLQQFAGLVHRIRKQNVPVILFMAPMAEPAFRAISQRPREYAYLQEVRAAASGWGAPFIDLLDPVHVSAADCEFIDGFHGGDIVYARIARELAAISGGLLQTTGLNDQYALIRNHPSVDGPPLCPSGPPLANAALPRPGEAHAPPTRQRPAAP